MSRVEQGIIYFLAMICAAIAGYVSAPDPKPVCGPDRCQSAAQACEYVRIHAAEIHKDVAKGNSDGIPVEFGYLADEFVEAACGY